MIMQTDPDFPTPDNRKTHYKTLFPPIQPYSSGFLKVSDIHSLYWEQCGNPEGEPIVFLHGGPGAGATTIHRRFFDPDYYRIIIFDQRGAGRSQPLSELEDNYPAALVEDVDRVRNHLEIPDWHIFGGSWGSTLAMMYARDYPDKCRSLILRGIFLMERDEIEWFLSGMKTIFPEAWEEFVSFIAHRSEATTDNILNEYIDLLNDENPDVYMNAAISWAKYEGRCSTLMPSTENIISQEQRKHALALAKIEAHYFKNHVVGDESSILRDIDKIRHIPCTIVQGRYDIICPMKTAHRLHEKWPESNLVVVPDGGHSALDPAIRSCLLNATENTKLY